MCSSDLNTETTLKPGEKKSDFDKDPVLERFKLQLEEANIKTNNCLRPNFSWAAINVDQLVNKFLGKKFILIFPFSSSKLVHKQWPNYNGLIELIKKNFSELEIVIAPGPKELTLSQKINATFITNNQKALSIPELAGLINKSIFVIANDTGPAHMAAHLGAKGVTLFGYHTTPQKVSIETNKFKAIIKDNNSKNMFSHINYGTFHKSFRLPENTLNNKISAKMENGILQIIIPVSKPVLQEAKTIKIN